MKSIQFIFFIVIGVLNIQNIKNVRFYFNQNVVKQKQSIFCYTIEYAVKCMQKWIV